MREAVSEFPEKMSRLGLATFGSYFLYTCSELWYYVDPAYSSPALLHFAPWFCILSGLLVLFGAASGRCLDRWQWLAIGLLLINQLLTQAVYVQAEVRNDKISDTVLLSLEAATLCLAGENPYGYPMADMYSAYESSAQAMTPHLDGHSVEVLPYPPLHFLLLVPLLFLGIEGPRLLYNCCHLALLLILFKKTPPEYRCLVVLPLLVNPEFARYPLSWGSDSVWVLLLGLMLWSWSKPSWRAILLGLACAYKQTPWLFAPFLFLRIWKEGGARQASRFLTISLAVFVAINLPFAWADGAAWFQGTFNPAVSPMIPFGRGWSILSQSLVAPFPREYYSLVSKSILLILLWAYWRNFARLRQGLWVFPALALFFAFRNLQHYFVFSVPLLLLDWVCSAKTETPPEKIDWSPLAGGLVAVISFSILYWPGAPVASMKIEEFSSNPVLTDRVKLQVDNLSAAPIRPRFFARAKWHAYPWYIESGPDILEPGQSAIYSISTDLSYRTLNGTYGGTFLLSDANQPNRYIAQASVTRQRELRYPRAFQTSAGSDWKTVGRAVVGENHVHLSAGPGASECSAFKTVVLPHNPIRLKVKVGFQPGPTESFSLNFRNAQGQPELTVYFGKHDKSYFVEGRFHKMLRTDLDKWTEHSLNVPQLYLEAGLSPPHLQRYPKAEIELFDRPKTLSLDLTSRSQHLEAQVKDIHIQEGSELGRVVQNLNRPIEYSALLGDLALRRRDYASAFLYYSKSDSSQFPRKLQNSTVYPGCFSFDPEGYVTGELLLSPSFRLSLYSEDGDPIEIQFGGQKLEIESGQHWTAPRHGLLTLEKQSQILKMEVEPAQ